MTTTSVNFSLPPGSLLESFDFVNRQMTPGTIDAARAAVDNLIAHARRLRQVVVGPDWVWRWTGESADAALKARCLAALVNGNITYHWGGWDMRHLFISIPSCDSLYRS